MSLNEKFKKVSDIPDQLERVSHNMAALTVAVVVLSFVAVAIALLALGRTRHGN